MIQNNELKEILIKNAKNLKVIEFNLKQDIAITLAIFRRNILDIDNDVKTITDLLGIIKNVRKQLGHIIKFGILSEKDKLILNEIISLNQEYNFDLLGTN